MFDSVDTSPDVPGHSLFEELVQLMPGRATFVVISLVFIGVAPACGSSTDVMSIDEKFADASPDVQPGEDEQPEPAEGSGLSDPPTNTLHNMCGGIDWQRIHGWLLHPHAAPELGPREEIETCVARYAGWVTHEADSAQVSRASVYAALAAAGQCAAEREYNGQLMPPAMCVSVNESLSEVECQAQMTESKAFGIETLARVLGDDSALSEHKRDIPLMAAYLGSGEVACGGDDRWQITAPPGYIDGYVAAYNAFKSLSTEPPTCSKRLVVTVALYTGIDTPGEGGVAAGNGCWTYERVSKTNDEWKICNYDGTVHHANGFKWAYDDTNTAHDTSTELSRISSCKAGVDGRGYVYMVNRGNGWPRRITAGVEAHFAEIYSGQFQVDDQFDTWINAGSPGHPMIHLGEPSTGASRIRDATRRACAEVVDEGYLGVYLYPESLRSERMSAMVRELNACTES